MCSITSNVPSKFYNLCRLCLSCPVLEDNQCKDAKLERIFDDVEERNIPRKIMTCLSIMVKDDDQLPQVICIRCSEQLDVLYGFKETAKKAEILLHQFLMCMKELEGTTQKKQQIPKLNLKLLKSNVRTTRKKNLQ
ncbi:Zinc-finger associated domain (zf-AD) [Popillia japonica]|uniref:Zinc-finger associated domain (Zf-AD) n=1 Tax=Popillia japonica TaxID=7064 RepID=A0AAW1L6M0_POPJA